MAQATQLIMIRPNLANLPGLAAPHPYEVRPYHDGDELSGAKALALSFSDPNWTPERYLSELARHEDSWMNFVAVASGSVVATATARRQPHNPEQGYVHYVGTHPQHTGHGLGYWVSLAVLHEFLRQGCTGAMLHTDDFRIPAVTDLFEAWLPAP